MQNTDDGWSTWKGLGDPRKWNGYEPHPKSVKTCIHVMTKWVVAAMTGFIVEGSNTGSTIAWEDIRYWFIIDGLCYDVILKTLHQYTRML